MDAITPILNKLGLDATFFTQFVIIIFLYVILRFIFVGKLQFVLEQREQQTGKKLLNAEEKFKKANVFAEEFTNKIQEAHADAHEKLFLRKKEIEKKASEIIFGAENRAENEFEAKVKEIRKEFDAKKKGLSSDVEKLSEELIKKIT
ncbi:MAG: hypothetical protein A2504_06520 [Bdellovibrionales bacterium RIFOXYD12_FULL_39_22]|nr:MAG: hypothetical protein A2385_08840 [Bdellovibrionales bacterium RIFOXYB1_FULL_39_21]OFZ45194.1 MAG: hypothetical protein A2485_05695 [Bdellovibrionales bacterium RIFOXYC12_FULL_39_17]OFZ45614.1 MAG: hypothetical protein A2404_03420 [Bdellovibrionales bacterium RIFOXYC1_FULL_39_130]OFZ77476.1 MAG: hypothetical protein A2560_09010 [Bdellovibrionales bacterium RIFOXYD1_FULL_39_84]OFZ91605.1 MAG: hypothetical protein A2504_06520 [Bdellovibrionales bacterium RIFOXYD12_FULL_39_22]HLE11933.1 AT